MSRKRSRRWHRLKWVALAACLIVFVTWFVTWLVPPPVPATLTPAETAALRALGYLATPPTTGVKGQCLACGYNLTGNVSGVCPECGTRITSP
jgi:hypothetical protein